MNTEAVKSFAMKTPILTTGAFLSGVVVGSTLGYLYVEHIVKTKLNNEAREIIRVETDQVREYYAKLNATKNDEIKSTTTPVEIVAKYRDTVQTEYGASPVPQSVKDSALARESIARMVSSTVEGEYDHEANVVPEPVDKDLPYLISVETFLENPDEFSNLTLTYYAGDDVLCGEQDEVVPIKAIGEDNLQNFGRGTTDANIMYIQNERLGTAFEVIRNPGSYSEVVLGLGG